MAGGTDQNLWIRPNSAAFNSTSYSAYTSTPTDLIYNLGMIYDLVMYDRLSVEY